jgi:signal transduction histidine kinase
VASQSPTDQSRLLTVLQQLLAIPAGNLGVALAHASDAIAQALGADKVDAFLHDASRDSLVAVGTSHQPLSALQRSLGLDVLPVANGGRTVQVYQTGKTFVNNRLDQDMEELRGIREAMGIRSELGVPLKVGGTPRGMLMAASLKPDFFNDNDVRFAEMAVHWVAMVAHRAELVEEIERNAVQEGRRTAAENIITVLAHDLRNYLAPVMTRLYRLRHRAQKNASGDDIEDVGAALRAMDRLNGLVNNILDVARLDQGLFELQLEPVDLGKFLEDASTALATPDHVVLVKISEHVVVSADPARLRQTMDNLISNALKHSRRNAPINIFVSKKSEDDRSFGLVEVVDEGPGVPPDLLPHIFDRFTSGHVAQGGLGLGLYVARRIAIAHGGDLHASREPGKGARFTLKLPCFEAGEF